MAMPQVHIVAYCGDLGYGVARGAEMLSLMMGFGIVSRIGSGFLADRIGGIRTLLIGSMAQGFALLFYLFFDGLTSLYVISAMFGLFQGGIVPSYAIIVREAMPAQRGRDPRRHRDLCLRVRHVVRRLGVGRDLRCHRLLRARRSSTGSPGMRSTSPSWSGCWSGRARRLPNGVKIYLAVGDQRYVT